MSANHKNIASDVFHFVTNCNYFANIPVIVLESDADGRLGMDYLLGEQEKAGGKGVLVTIAPPIKAPLSNAGPHLGLAFVAIVQENEEINTTGKDADAIADELLRVINDHVVQGFGAFYADNGESAIEPTLDFLPIISRVVKFKNSQQFEPPSRNALPTISEISGTVTLTVTEGTCYYTTDDSCPAPTNTGATLYAGAFTVTSGTVVRWAAYSTTKEPSAFGRAQIT